MYSDILLALSSVPPVLGVKSSSDSASGLRPLSPEVGVQHTLWRGWLCGSELILVCLTLTHTEGFLNKPSVHLSSGCLHSSIQQILRDCQALFQVLEAPQWDSDSMEVGRSPESLSHLSGSMKLLKLTENLSCTT